MVASPVVLLDLDGVVWRGEEPIPGADAAVARLVDAGCHVAFFTNNSYVTTDEVVAKLERQHICPDRADVLSSALAAATLVEPGDRALVVGGPGILEALAERGVSAAHCDGEGETDGFDSVVVGIDLEFTYARLAQAMAAILGGARLLGTNDDATYPAPGRDLPGGGAILAAVSTATHAHPVIAGKPHLPAAALVRSRLGPVELVVGDRPSTDGAFARRLGAKFGLVYSGVTRRDAGLLDLAPEFHGDDLLAVANDWANELRTRQPETT